MLSSRNLNSNPLLPFLFNNQDLRNIFLCPFSCIKAHSKSRGAFSKSKDYLRHRSGTLAYDWKKYTSGPRYWNVPVLVNTGTFLVYQYCLKMWYLHPLEHAGIIQKLTILECKNGLVLANTRVPVSGTWSILFPFNFLNDNWCYLMHAVSELLQGTNLA